MFENVAWQFSFTQQLEFALKISFFLWGSWQEQNGSILIKSSFVVVMSPFAVADESKVKPTDTDESKKIENDDCL